MRNISPKEYIGQGNILIELNLLDKAEEIFKLCINKFPDNIVAKERYAYTALRKLDFENAYTRYKNITQEHPEHISGYIGQGNVLLQQNLLDKAEEIYKLCINKFPDNIVAKERYAYTALRKLDFENAYTRYKNITQEHPEHISGYIGQGNVLLQQNLLDKAEEIYKLCINKFPDNIVAKERYAYTALRKLDFENAYTRYKDITQEHPEHISGYIGQGNVLLQQNILDDAGEIFTLCINKFPDNIVAKERYAYTALRKLDFENAYTRYKDITQEHPEHISGYIGQGNVLLQQNLLDEAEEIFKLCVNKFPDNIVAKERYAYTALRKLKFKNACTRYKKLTQDHPEYVSGYIGQGNVLLEQNLLDEAEEIFKFCVIKFPNNFLAKERYAHIALRNLDFENARARYKKLAQDHPDNVSGYIGQGRVLFNQDRFDEAEVFFNHCLIKFNYDFKICSTIVTLHNSALKRNIHFLSPSFTKLAFLAYGKAVKNRFHNNRVRLTDQLQ